jgi:hypothetical protein
VWTTNIACGSSNHRHGLVTQRVRGKMTNLQTKGTTTTKASETKIGRTTDAVLKDVKASPRLEITWTMTRPTTSSIIAALVSMTPNRVSVKPLALSTVKVVPRLVEHSAAPAANACKGDASSSFWRVKDRAIGSSIPVTATAIERKRFALRAENDVHRPPVAILTHDFVYSGERC